MPFFEKLNECKKDFIEGYPEYPETWGVDEWLKSSM
jgi:hypothetical protein